MAHIIGIVLIILGVLLIGIAAVGIIRMPDLYTRMSSSTKASTLGLGLVLLGTAIYFLPAEGSLGIASRAIATIIFVMLTAPVSAHMMGRAAYSNGVELWEGTVVDELKGQYEESDGALNANPNAKAEATAD